MKLSVTAIMLIIDTLTGSLRIAGDGGGIFSYSKEDRLMVKESLEKILSTIPVEITVK